MNVNHYLSGRDRHVGSTRITYPEKQTHKKHKMNKQIKEVMNRCGLYLPVNNPEVFDKELEFFVETLMKDLIEGLINTYNPDDNLPITEIKCFVESRYKDK